MATQDQERYTHEVQLPADRELHRRIKADIQDSDKQVTSLPVRDVPENEAVNYAWDWPTASKKRLRLTVDGVPLPQSIDMMAIGVQPPIKLVSPVTGTQS